MDIEAKTIQRVAREALKLEVDLKQLAPAPRARVLERAKEALAEVIERLKEAK